jgi:hypothetical protein
VDILDGTPLLDIKPFVPRFDMAEGARGGWTEAVDDDTARQGGQGGFTGRGLLSRSIERHPAVGRLSPSWLNEQTVI